MKKIKINKINISYKIVTQILLVSVMLFGVPPLRTSQAATIGVQPLLTQVEPGKTFSIRVSINTQGKTINNGEATINFPADLVEVVSVSSSGIFTLWVESPSISNSAGRISFNGGVPNPGFKGSGQVISAVFKAKKTGTANFSISGAAIRENDGLGTNILSGQGGGSILIIEAKKPDEKPKEEVKTPDTKPVTPIGRVTITSLSHPNSELWYKEKRATFNWRIPSGTTASQTSLDQSATGIPSVTRRPAINAIAVDVPNDGIWYFHARFLVGSTWSPVYTYKIQVDTTPPDNFNVSVKSNSDNNLSAIMTATDKNSQLAYYTVQIDSQLPINVPFVEPETSLLLPLLSKGSHVLTAIAYDKAGNSITKIVEFESLDGEKIIINEYEKEIADKERIKLSGLASANTPLRVSLVTKNGLIRYYFIQTQLDGTFSFISEPIVGGGEYTIVIEREATLEKPALSSEEIKIFVKDSIIEKSRNWFLGLKSLITLFNILILFLIIFGLFGWYKYLRLRHYVGKKFGKKSSVKSLGEEIKKKLKK